MVRASRKVDEIKKTIWFYTMQSLGKKELFMYNSEEFYILIFKPLTFISDPHLTFQSKPCSQFYEEVLVFIILYRSFQRTNL